MTQAKRKELRRQANLVRQGVIEAVYGAKSGHPGGSLSIADILTYLYFDKMRIDPADPRKADRDRFVLSKGHAAPGLYAALAQRGYFPTGDLKTLRHADSYLQGHPDLKKIPGVDMSTGSLGQGISAAVGMALAAAHAGDAYRVYCIVGDGELEEGQVWEAAMFAAHKKLHKLTVFVDLNGLQIDGGVDEVNSPQPVDQKFRAFLWNVVCIDGHDFDQIEAAVLAAEQVTDRPTAIIARTVKGKGVSFMENQVGWHGAAPNDEQYQNAMRELRERQNALELEVQR